MHKLFFIFTGILIALGYTPAPITPYNLGRDSIWVDISIWFINVSPILPLLLALINVVIWKPVNKVLSVFFAILIGIGGTLISLLIAGFSGVGSSFVLIHGVSLSIALSISLLLLSYPRGSNTLNKKLFLAMLVPATIAIWSLTSMAANVWQAKSLAGSHSYCLAPHTPDTNNIEAISQLRGLSFYSRLSGFKESSRWYFHGILIIDTEEGREIYNWSPQRMTFERVTHPKRFIVSPINVCAPTKAFLNILPVW